MKEGGFCGFDHKLKPGGDTMSEKQEEYSSFKYPKPENDSKFARSCLRNILKEQGHQIDDHLVLNSSEMLDMIIKNIHLVDLEVRNLRKAKKAFLREHENRSQLVMEAISGYYDTQKGKKL